MAVRKIGILFLKKILIYFVCVWRIGDTCVTVYMWRWRKALKSSLLQSRGSSGSNPSPQAWWQATDLSHWTLVYLAILWQSFLGLGMDGPFLSCPLGSGHLTVPHCCSISQCLSHHKASCWHLSLLPGWEDLVACFPVCSPPLSRHKFPQIGPVRWLSQ